MASAIADGLQDEGYKKVDVSEAEAEITTVVTVVSDNDNDDKNANDDAKVIQIHKKQTSFT